jgi:formate dehydrogenase
MSGTSIDAQKRYAAGTKAILDEYFSGRENYKPGKQRPFTICMWDIADFAPQRLEDLIVHKGDYATKAYGQREKK